VRVRVRVRVRVSAVVQLGERPCPYIPEANAEHNPDP